MTGSKQREQRRSSLSHVSREAMCKQAGLYTLDGLIKSSLDSHIRYDCEVKLARPILLTEEFYEPLALGFGSYSSTDLVASEEELVNDVGGNETIRSSHKDRRALFDWCHGVERGCSEW